MIIDLIVWFLIWTIFIVVNFYLAIHGFFDRPKLFVFIPSLLWIIIGLEIYQLYFLFTPLQISILIVYACINFIFLFSIKKYIPLKKPKTFFSLLHPRYILLSYVYVLAQQLMIVGLLFIVSLFWAAMIFFIIHIPLLFFKAKPLHWIIVIGALGGGFLFSWLIIVNLFFISFIVHSLFYSVLSLVLRYIDAKAL